ncbi:rha-1 [Symbiodinium pilosum]|uniref:Rha-1 protein n=1 Tax=Symbiodinium pilosum TaxID=2952 RepID=A0A812TYV8_SYMPI|nr:rha-1 [Symbiodinium pilosum]
MSKRPKVIQGEQLMVGRRFMDQLRAPAKRASGSRGLSVMAGPRGSDEEEEAMCYRCLQTDALPCPHESKALQAGHPVDEGSLTIYADEDEELDLEEEFEDFEDDDEEPEEDEEDEEEEDDAEEGDPLILDEDDAASRLPWKKARNEMLMAVNSLPVTGRRYHHRILVVKVKTSQKDSPGSVHMDQLPGLMTQLCGRPPQFVSKEGKKSEFAAVCFPAETIKELSLPLGPAPAQPSVLAGASTSVSLGHAFSLGARLVDFDGEVVARPSSPYQITFFLPERNTRNDEEKQKQVRALLEARNPVGLDLAVEPVCCCMFCCSAPQLQTQVSPAT